MCQESGHIVARSISALNLIQPSKLAARVQDFVKTCPFSMPRLGHLGVEFQKMVCTPKFFRMFATTWR